MLILHPPEKFTVTMKNCVVLTGAGISVESGLKTFRGEDGLWEGIPIDEVATPEAWRRNPARVQKFYNERRKQILEAEPNPAHYALVKLESFFNTCIITQNIDNLHERAGSKNVLHLHGVITKSQSSLDPKKVYAIDGWELKMGDKCERGSQLRPHVVWFGEAVPMIEIAAELCSRADILIIVGTSLVVYPAASLIHYVPTSADRYLIDPAADLLMDTGPIKVIREPAGEALPELVDYLAR